MSTSRFNINQWLSRILLIAIIGVSAAVMYAIDQLDKIVNVQLYDYNLHFSLDWANPYWGLTKIIYISLGATIIMSTIVLLLGLIKTKKPASTLISLKPEKPSPKPTAKPTPAPVYAQPKAEPAPTPKIAVVESKPQTATSDTITVKEEEKKTKTNKSTAKQAAQAPTGACPSCKKTFSQPLVMLDFEGGKSKLVNVCPYCNQVLGDTEQNQ